MRLLAIDATGFEAIFLEVLLVVFLATPEGLRGFDLGGNRLTELLCGVQAFNSLVGKSLLVRSVEEDDASVLIAYVWALAVELGGIVQDEECVQKSLVGDERRIEGELDDFGVAGFVVADVLVCWAGCRATGVADGGIGDAWDLAKLSFDAPKAASAKGGELGRGTWCG